MVKCKKCGNQEGIKNIYVKKENRKTNEKIKVGKAMCIMLYEIGKVSINKITKTFNMCW